MAEHPPAEYQCRQDWEQVAEAHTSGHGELRPDSAHQLEQIDKNLWFV